MERTETPRAGSPFADLTTEPAELRTQLWELYGRFVNGDWDGIRQERRRIIGGGVVHCPMIEEMTAYRAAGPRDRDDPERYGDVLFRMQYAVDTHQQAMDGYRESGLIDRVEVLKDGCCSVCDAVDPIVSVYSDLTIPIPGCLKSSGCSCCVAPIVALGEV